MPAYITPTTGNPTLLVPGVPGYSAGSFDSDDPTTRMQVTASAVASNVVTLTVQIIEGLIPVVGATAYITGTSNNAGALNQPNGVALTGVSINSTTGAGTITYADTTGNLSTTADAGTVLIPVAEVGDALTSNTKYLQFAVPQPSGFSTSGRSVSWSTVVGGAPSPVTINLQGSLVDVDSQYSTLDTSTNTTGETRIITNVSLPFLRVTTGTITGGISPTLVAKIEV